MVLISQPILLPLFLLNSMLLDSSSYFHYRHHLVDFPFHGTSVEPETKRTQQEQVGDQQTVTFVLADDRKHQWTHCRMNKKAKQGVTQGNSGRPL